MGRNGREEDSIFSNRARNRGVREVVMRNTYDYGDGRIAKEERGR